MQTPDGIDTAIQRKLLQVTLRNSARSVVLLVVAVVFIAWLAVLTLVMGLVVAVWRAGLQRRFGGDEELSRKRIGRVVRELELNAGLVGLMWVLATLLIYPLLAPTSATVYVVIICGSVATAAFFMSMVGRSFEWLMALQLGWP